MGEQRGFSLVEVLLTVLVLCVAGFASYTVWSNNQDDSVKTEEILLQEQQSAEPNIEVSIDEDVDNMQKNRVYEVEINSLVTLEDTKKLPEYTPVSFKQYIAELLRNNTPKDDGCISSYSIVLISNFNINGGASSNLASPAGEEGEDLACGSGAPLMWVLNPDSSWEEISRNGTLCRSEGNGLVYEEFAAECFDGEEFIKNPNGSVLEAIY